MVLYPCFVLYSDNYAEIPEQPNPWLAVDLVENTTINSLVITNRLDPCCSKWQLTSTLSRKCKWDNEIRWAWWRHQMETFSALLAICAGNSPVPGEFPAQRPVARSFDVFFDLRLNKRLSKEPWGWWFETLSWSLWRHCNGGGGGGVSVFALGPDELLQCKSI